MSTFYHIKSIAQVHQVFGLERPFHPLISIVRKWPESELDFENIKLTSDLYILTMISEIDDHAFQYGRNSYDDQEGTLVCMAPNQTASFADSIEEEDEFGWTILFHPDLIRKSEFGKTIKDYSFFNYAENEALHVSEQENMFLLALVEQIELEIKQNKENLSLDLIIQNLDAILKSSYKFYARQLYSRSAINKDFIPKFNSYLASYFSSTQIIEIGIPTVHQCGEALHISGAYLSDILKFETGRRTKDHILAFIIEKGKSALRHSSDSIAEVSFNLGYKNAQGFSKIFKTMTGMSPSEYRNLNT